jgi:hypothetical protein
MVYFMIILSNTGIAFVVFYFPFCEHVASYERLMISVGFCYVANSIIMLFKYIRGDK